MRRWLISLAVLLLLASGAYLIFKQAAPIDTAATPTSTAVDIARDQIVAEAKVVPVRSAQLSFAAAGTITEVLVQLGDHVFAGQPLARLDARRLRAALAQAQADLAQAQASDRELRAGAGPGDLAAAEAQLRQAQAQLRQVSGEVTPADLTAAQAALQQAKAQLARLQAGPSAEQRAGEAALQESQANLVSQRDHLSAAKTNAQLELDRATQALTQAQSSAATAKRNWDYVQDTGADPITPKIADPANPAKTKPNKLNDTQRQQYYDAYIQAAAAQRSAESAVQQAQVAYDTARQAEISGDQAAQAQVASAQANLDKLHMATGPDQIAAAQAQVASAQANLDKLRGGQRGGSLDAAQAAVDLAQANLDKLRAGASQIQLDVSQAQVQRAAAALESAQAALAETELKAPFDGIVASLALRSGEYATPGAPMIRIADPTSWQLETSDLSELGIVQIAAGAPVTITFDAIPNLTLSGKVSQIETFGENKQGNTVYTVVITPDRQDARLRWNMTASVRISTQR
jgi:HlyD family secretion protein